LCGVFLCLSLTATANDSAGTPDVSGTASAPAAPAPSLLPSDREPWQAAIGFKYQHLNAYGISFHNLGYSVDVTRYVNNWLGFEGGLVTCLGHSVPGGCSVFFGGGPHIVVTTRRRIEPWVHVLPGLMHMRLTQTASIGGPNAFGLTAGGGADVQFYGRLAWRVQGDYIATRYQSKFQNDYSIGTGVVLSF